MHRADVYDKFPELKNLHTMLFEWLEKDGHELGQASIINQSDLIGLCRSIAKL